MDDELMVTEEADDGAEDASSSDGYDLETPGLTMEELVAVPDLIRPGHLRYGRPPWHCATMCSDN